MSWQEKKIDVAVIGGFAFYVLFWEYSKTAPVSLDSCLVIYTDSQNFVTDQLGVTLASALIVSEG